MAGVGGVFKGAIRLGILGAVAFGVLLYLVGTIVPAGYLGVRQVFFGPGKGISNNSVKPGLHFSVPFYTVVHVLPATVQVLQLNRESGSQLKNLTTSDGALLDVDVTIFYSLFPEQNNPKGGKVASGPATGQSQHGGPGELIRNLSTNQSSWSRQIAGVAEKALRSKLPNLSASSFYDPDLRQRLTDEAKADMGKALAPFGIKIEDVLLRRYTYQSQRIDDAIFEKNLQDQEVRLNEARSKFAEAKAKLERESAEWDARVKTLEVRGQNESEVIRSEAAMIETQLKAKADLEVARATAEVDRQKASALSSAAGADVFVARKTAPLVSSLKGGVVSGIDPYDLDAWSDKLGVRKNQ